MARYQRRPANTLAMVMATARAIDIGELHQIMPATQRRAKANDPSTRLRCEAIDVSPCVGRLRQRAMGHALAQRLLSWRHSRDGCRAGAVTGITERSIVPYHEAPNAPLPRRTIR